MCVFESVHQFVCMKPMYMCVETERQKDRQRALEFLCLCARAFDGVPVLAWLALVDFQYKRGQMSCGKVQAKSENIPIGD